LRAELSSEREAARSATARSEERLAAVRREYESAAIPSLKAAHREEMDMATHELEAAHKQVTSLLRKNRALAEAIALGHNNRDGGDGSRIPSRSHSIVSSAADK
jgi:predicted translin family RNA/ssDNA-binding protein